MESRFLFRLKKRKASKFKQSWVKKLTDKLSSIAKLLAYITGFATFIFFFTELWDSDIVLEPFHVPSDLAKMGYSGQVFVNKLEDEFRIIQDVADNSELIEILKKKSDFGRKEALSWNRVLIPENRVIKIPTPIPDIKIPGAGISLQPLIHYIKSRFRQQTRIKSEVTLVNDMYTITTRVGRRPAWHGTGKINNIEALLPKMAKYIYKYTEPLTLAAYFVVEEKDSVAITVIDYCLENETDKDDVWAYFLKGLIFYYQADDSASVENFTKVLEIKPDQFDAAFYLAFGLAELERYEKAVNIIDRAVKINSENDNAWYNRGYYLDKLGNHTDAIASYDKAIEINPDKDDVWYSRGNSLAKLGNQNEAIASYNKAIEINPDKDDVWYNRGNSLAKLGNHNEAIASYDKAIEINTNKANAWYNRANSLFDLKRYKEAIESYDKVLEINPNDEDARIRRSEAVNAYEQEGSPKTTKKN